MVLRVSMSVLITKLGFDAVQEMQHFKELKAASCWRTRQLTISYLFFNSNNEHFRTTNEIAGLNMTSVREMFKTLSEHGLLFQVSIILWGWWSGFPDKNVIELGKCLYLWFWTDVPTIGYSLFYAMDFIIFFKCFD